MKFVVILLFVFTLCGCSSLSNTGQQNEDDFSKNMNSGKSAMKNEYYRAALHYFRLAKIDKPNDKDLEVLLNMANENIKKELNNMKMPEPDPAIYHLTEDSSWRDKELAKLDEHSIRDQGTDNNGDTFEDIVTQKELSTSAPDQVDYEQVFIDWRKNYHQ
ncbi:hypothetical protein [Paenibacillus kyungheensis]